VTRDRCYDLKKYIFAKKLWRNPLCRIKLWTLGLNFAH
jgi:hypothetical protein